MKAPDTRFDLTSAWDDAVTLLRTDQALTMVLAGVFLFLPALVFGLFGPVPISAPPSADFAQQMAALNQYLLAILPWLIIASIVSSIGGVAIMRLWLAETGTSVADAIGFALALLPTLIVIYFVLAFATGLAALALLLPAFYLTGRLAPLYPLLAAGETRGALEALANAWDLTRGNGWRIALMLILIQLVVGLLSFLVEGLGGVLGEPGSPGAAFAAAANALLATVGAMIGYAVSAAVYRQLRYRPSAGTFD